MKHFTPEELNILRRRMSGAVFGLQRELAYRRHTLTVALVRDQRYDIFGLIRLRRHYAQLAVMANTLNWGETLPDIRFSVGDLLTFLVDELDLTNAAVKYITAQGFSWRTKARLLRILDIEIRFFSLIIDHLGQHNRHKPRKETYHV